MTNLLAALLFVAMPLSAQVTYDMTGRGSLMRFTQGEAGYADFAFGMGDSAGSNGETRHDRYLCWGYNVGPACAQQIATDQAFFFSIENHFRTAEFIRQSEFYMTFKWPNAAFPDVRVFGITPHTETAFVQTDFASSQFNVNDLDGTNYARLTPTGPSFSGASAFFNNGASAVHRAQVDFSGLTAQRTYTAPDAGGTLVLSDSNSIVNLSGGLKAGSGGTFGNKIAAQQFVAPADTGSYVSPTGADVQIVGRDATSVTSTFVPVAAQTVATAHFTDSARGTKASVMPTGKVYGTSFAIGTDAEFGNTVTLAATVTANRTATLPNATGTVLVATNDSGAGSAALGSNCPAATPTAPFTWLKVTASDGSVVWVPAWK